MDVGSGDSRHEIYPWSMGGKAIYKTDTPEKIENEHHILSKLRHPNVPEVLYKPSDDRIYIRYVDGKDVFNVMIERDFVPYTGTEASSIISKLVCILRYLHSQKVAHMDIKCENVIMGDDGDVYLIDYGLSMDLERERVGKRYPGTYIYAAPEIMYHDPWYDPYKADIYSLGVLWYCLLKCKFPYTEDVKGAYLNGDMDLEIDFSDICQKDMEMILKILSVNPDDRPSLDSIYEACVGEK